MVWDIISIILLGEDVVVWPNRPSHLMKVTA